MTEQQVFAYQLALEIARISRISVTKLLPHTTQWGPLVRVQFPRLTTPQIAAITWRKAQEKLAKGEV